MRKMREYILTYSMVQILSSAANCFAAIQEICRFSWIAKVNNPTQKRLPHVFILGQSNPFHITTSHILEIHPNIIHQFTPRYTQ